MAAQPDPESKTLQIWDREVHYRLEIRQDPSLSFDGEARQEKGSSQFKVLLNTAFLRPEADQIFVALLQANNLPPAGIPNEKDGLKKIEKALLSGRKISANSVRYLEAWKQVLENGAWKPVLERCRQSHPELEELRECFRGEFAKIRLRTIEYHEASHLLDLADSPGETLRPGFEQRSELNAFFAELAYGENPLDVMAQALAGWLEEARRGKEVDASSSKVRKILELLENHPRFATRVQSGESPTCCLELLRELAVQDFQMAGRALYAQY